MRNDKLGRCLELLGQLQNDVLDSDPHGFGEGYSKDAIQECVEAWEVVNACSDMFLKVVRESRGILRPEN